MACDCFHEQGVKCGPVRSCGSTVPFPVRACPSGAARDEITAFGLGVAELIVERARPLYPRFNLAWPTALASVAASRLRSELGIETAHWLY